MILSEVTQTNTGCSLSYVGASFEPLGMCVSAGAPTQVRKLSRSHGENFQGWDVENTDAMKWAKGVMEQEGLNGVGMGGKVEEGI